MRKLSLLIVGMMFLPCLVMGDGWQGGISLFFVTDKVNCKIIKTYQKEKPYNSFDTSLNVGEVIRVIDQTSANQLVATKGNFDGYLIFDSKELFNKSIHITYKKEWAELLNKLSENELMLSFLLDYPVHIEYEQRKKLTLVAEKILAQHTTDQMKILCVGIEENIEENLFIKELSIEKIRTMYQYNYNRYIDNKNPEQNYMLLKKIVSDETIPYPIRRQYINTFLYYYNHKTNNLVTKVEYFDFIIKIINEYPKYIIPDYETYSQIDQKAVFSVLRCYENNIIDLNDLYSISNRILEIDLNPAVTLLAYRGLVKYYLSNNEYEKAFQAAKDAIVKYDEPISWRYYKAPQYLNVTPAIIFLEHFYDKGTIQKKYINYIEQFKKSAYKHEELINYFNFCLAREKLFSNYTIKEVIQAYEMIDINSENNYEFYPQTDSGFFERFVDRRDKEEISEIINSKKFIMKVASDSIKIKEHILSNEVKVIYFPKDSEILMHHCMPSVLEKDNKYIWWFKGEINDKIFWVHTGDLK